MQTLESNKKPNLEHQIDENSGNLPDFTTDAYKDAYSRINAIVIEGEQEAYDNYISIASLLPKDSEELTKLAKMELKHKRGFIACGKNLSVEADMVFAKEFFSKLHGNFQIALENENLTTCLLIHFYTYVNFLLTISPHNSSVSIHHLPRLELFSSRMDQQPLCKRGRQR